MKKALALILCIVMTASVAACASSDDSGAAADPDAPVGGGTVTVWCWDPAFNLYAMEEAAKVYKEINPDFEIEIVEYPWDDIQTTIITAATANTLDILPDIFLMQDNAFQKNVIMFPEIFVDLTNSGINFNEFGPGKRAFSVVDGKNFGVPFDAGTTVFALRTDIVSEAGFTVDDFTDITWEQFIEQGKVLLAETGMPLVSTTSGGGDFIAFMLQSAGSSLFNDDGSPNIANNDALKESINVYLELVSTGVLLEVNNWDEYIASFVNGTVAGTISGCWILGSVQTAQDQSGLWALTNVPRLDIQGGTNYSSWGGSSWAVTSSSENTALAIDFLKNTFAGSAAFYETILPSAGALATWTPVGSSSVYMEPQPFFANQTIYADIVRFTSNVPAVATGEFFYEARDAVTAAVVNILDGADLQSSLQEAENLVLFQIG